MNQADPPLSARLFHLLADGRLHSGSALARQLGVTRAAIWKQIHTLEDAGLPIQHQPRAGYRLAYPMQPLQPENLLRKIQQTLPQTQVKTCWQCASTQLEATRLLRQAQAPVAVFCEWQTDGRGRRGRQWYSCPGASLVLSVAAQLPTGMPALQTLPLQMGIRLAQTLHHNGLAVTALKWPNDLVCWQDGQLHKLGGLLLSLEGEMEGPVTVTAGLGLNLYPLDHALPNPGLPMAGLAQYGRVDRNALAAELACAMLQTLLQAEARSFAGLQATYNRLHALHGKTVRLQDGHNSMQGQIEGVDENGQLLLKSGHKTLTIAAGEISVRPDENTTD